MIKIFRKNRQKLIGENKFSKYVLYALGEILLVIIGILIALNINNWNEESKLKKEEIKSLKHFRVTVMQDLYINSWHIQQFDLAKNSIDVLIKHMESDLPYKDSLKFHFAYTTQNWKPYINYDAYEKLKSIEFNLISNEELRNEIVSYYSFADDVFSPLFDRYFDIMEHAQRNIYNTRFDAAYNMGINESPKKDFHYQGKVSDLKLQMIPNDFEALKKDKEFLYFLRSQKNQLYWYVEQTLRNEKHLAEQLLKSIDKELKSYD